MEQVKISENYHNQINELLKQNTELIGHNLELMKESELNQKMNLALVKGIKGLLKTIYHEIDIHCISETENVSMTTIRKILVKHGAIESELY